MEAPKNAVYFAMHYLDKYVSMLDVSVYKQKEIDLSVLYLASKIDNWALPIESFLRDNITKENIKRLSLKIAAELNFYLRPRTLYQHMMTDCSYLIWIIHQRELEKILSKNRLELYRLILEGFILGTRWDSPLKL